MNDRNADPGVSQKNAAGWLGRITPLAGVAFAALTFAGYSTIGTFPESDVVQAKLDAFYAARHGNLVVGGWLLAWSAIFFAIFGVAVWAKIRRSNFHPAVAGAALIGVAVSTVASLDGATTYHTLGLIGHKGTIAPAALQAWHISGSEGGLTDGGGVALLLFAVAVAGFAGRTFPRWLSATGLVIGLMQLTPIGFIASLAFLLWSAVAGLTLFLRPGRADHAGAQPGARALHADPVT